MAALRDPETGGLYVYGDENQRIFARFGQPPVPLVPCAADAVIDTGDDHVERLLDAGWRPEHIALLTMGSRHPIQKERQVNDGHLGYWRSFWENDDVFYGHVLGCKGLERRAVVRCVNSIKPERAREMLYVGRSRATDQLVVVGDPSFVRQIGGDRWLTSSASATWRVTCACGAVAEGSSQPAWSTTTAG